jgi:Flp pilus assembly pilin Flp
MKAQSGVLGGHGAGKLKEEELVRRPQRALEIVSQAKTVRSYLSRRGLGVCGKLEFRDNPLGGTDWEEAAACCGHPRSRTFSGRGRSEEELGMSKILNRFVTDDRGLETIEYAIVAGLIVVGVITAVTAIGVWVAGKWSALKTNLGA